jgi:cyclopropane fatty-acyl-phospholipid synthase-like methyltransferase
MSIREEADVLDRFGSRYGRVAPVLVELERAVLGSDHAANGYTTLAQADVLVAALDIRPGERLLDVGAGCGWPGLYIAARSGCAVVAVDLPMQGIRRARERALQDGLAAHAVRASARHLPFRARSFDAIVHTDVLC